MLVLVHSPPEDLTVVARSLLLGSAWLYDRGDWRWSFGTVPGWTRLASTFPDPGRSVVSLEDRRAALALARLANSSFAGEGGGGCAAFKRSAVTPGRWLLRARDCGRSRAVELWCWGVEMCLR